MRRLMKTIDTKDCLVLSKEVEAEIIKDCPVVAITCCAPYAHTKGSVCHRLVNSNGAIV